MWTEENKAQTELRWHLAKPGALLCRTRRCSRTLALFCSCGFQCRAGFLVWISNWRVVLLWNDGQPGNVAKKNKKQRAEECRFICQRGDGFSSDLIHLIPDVRRWAGPLSTPGCDWCSAVSADGWMAAAGPSRHSPVSLPARKIFKIPKLRASSPTLRGYCTLFFKVLSLHVLWCTREKHWPITTLKLFDHIIS